METYELWSAEDNGQLILTAIRSGVIGSINPLPNGKTETVHERDYFRPSAHSIEIIGTIDIDGDVHVLPEYWEFRS